MLLRLSLLLACALLTGCIRPPAQQTPPAATPTTTPAPSATDAALPSAATLAEWVLTPGELEYIRYTRSTLQLYIPDRVGGFEELAAAFRADAGVLTDNRWRAQITSAGAALTEMSYLFDPDVPSARFAAIVAQVDKIAALLRGADRYTKMALEQNDPELLAGAEKMLATLHEEVTALENVFALLVGPAEN